MPKSMEALGLRGGLIVSCQPSNRNSPFNNTELMVAMAIAAKNAGAVGIRANSPETIKAIRDAVNLPIIGIDKVGLTTQHKRVYITPTFEHARGIADLGCEIIALHVLPEYDRDLEALKLRIRRIKEELDVLLMADVATVEDALFAVEQGVDIVATTSARYAYPEEKIPGPPIDLIAELVNRIPVPVIGEGHFHTPEQFRAAIEAGAHAVVVGTALTAPDVLMKEFVATIKQM
ncbi:MAG: N-acetylmannosamine-6-phosphate 2-epimerase [Anaerolineaceae bacterium]|nr:N-acetylmannosamine-6-phosphate 2-epimerase [Anaerolineaceae bacterium]